MEMESITGAIIVKPTGAAIYSELATTIRIEDEAGGLFIEVEQCVGKIQIDPEEWPSIKAAVEEMLQVVRGQK